MRQRAAVASESESATTNPTATDWRLWCRLCSKEDPDNVNVYFRDGEKEWTSLLAVAIGKYFWVNIKMEDELSNMLCRECYSLVEELVEFSERVNRVQTLFGRLQHADPQAAIDYDELRNQSGLQSDDWKHIISRSVKNEKQPEQTSMAAQYLNETAVPYDEDAEILAEIEGEELLDGDASTYTSYSVQEEEPDPEPELEPESGHTEPIDELEKITEQGNNQIKIEPVVESVPIDELELDASPAHPPMAAESVASCPEEDFDYELDKFKCHICGKYYKKPKAYKRHMAEAHCVEPSDLPDLECKLCQRSFPTESQLATHNRTHMEPKEKADSTCSHCNKVFTTPAALRRHIACIHDKLKPYMCDCCGKAMKTITALNEHKLVHTDECPFECPECHRRFKTKSRLKIHADIHTSENYACDICGLKLNTRRTLNMHKLVHSDQKQYKCDVCGAAFKRGKTLKLHLILHAGIRPYECNFCGKTFSNGSNCRMHKRKMHPEELAAEESSGVVRATMLPMLTELTKASKCSKTPPKASRTNKMHALLKAAEEGEPAAEAPQSVVETDPVTDANDDPDAVYADGEVMYEFIDEEMDCA